MRRTTYTLLVVAALTAAACSSSTPAPVGAGSGPVAGTKDTHCRLEDGGTRVQKTDPAVCTAPSPPSTMKSWPLRPLHDPASGYGPPMYNAEGDDDDCKYHMSWSSTGTGVGVDVTFTVAVQNKTDGAPAAGGAAYAEVFLDDTHPAPNAPTKTNEAPAGTYTIGPVRFDKPGVWSVRFHVFDTCASTAPESLHGHAAFFVNVP